MLTLQGLHLNQGWFLHRWGEAAALRASVSAGSRAYEVTLCVGPLGDMESVRSSLLQTIQAALQTIQDQLSTFLSAFEKERSLLFDPVRYVRHSQLQTLLERHESKRTPELDQRFNVWRLHSLRPKSALAEELVRRYEAATAFFDRPEKARRDHIEAFVRSQALAEADYFLNVEAPGLTPEQIEASLAFDDTNVAVAAAGSGKTSVMVAKVGYALKAGLWTDKEILVLAYNNAAAKELRDRIAANVGKLLERPIRVEARTFHSLGFRLWLSHRKKHFGRDDASARPKLISFDKPIGQRLLSKVLLSLVSDPRQEAFREALLHWACNFRYPVPELDAVDKATLQEREWRYEAMCKRISRGAKRGLPWYEPAIPTFDPHCNVRSNEEAKIANWLYLRGVDFKYEQGAYKWITAEINKGLPEEDHVKVYKPDFTYANPAASDRPIIHEHFGLNAAGRAPDFLGSAYEERAAHKRGVLQRILGRDSKTSISRFIETRSAQCRDGSIFDYLARQLEMRGIKVGPVDESRRERALKELGEVGPLLELICEFVPKFRDSGLTFGDLEQRARRLSNDNQTRALLFLRWMRVFMAELQREIDKGSSVKGVERSRPMIDFAGMIAETVDLLREATSPLTRYKLILVDEFQDISRLRAQLVQGLLDQHPADSVLFCVGDDWQAINRFAGADVAIFKSTHEGLRARQSESGASPIKPRSTDARVLRKTFRCAQGIADVARWFVMRTAGRAHIDKAVEAVNPATHGVVQVIEHADDPGARVAAVRLELQRFAAAQGEMKPGIATRVFILTRNRKDTKLPEGLDAKVIATMARHFKGKGLEVIHSSLHGSKGLGADYVIMVGLDAGKGGFPSDHPQEPLIEMLLPPQRNAIEEERRLFYVGLTRAKREVSLLCVADRPSPFVTELEKFPVQGVVQFHRLSGVTRYLCPRCDVAWLRSKLNKPLVECSRTLHCGFTDAAENFPGLSAKALKS